MDRAGELNKGEARRLRVPHAYNKMHRASAWLTLSASSRKSNLSEGLRRARRAASFFSRRLSSICRRSRLDQPVCAACCSFGMTAHHPEKGHG